jgi:hypothetical protein
MQLFEYMHLKSTPSMHITTFKFHLQYPLLLVSCIIAALLIYDNLEMFNEKNMFDARDITQAD